MDFEAVQAVIQGGAVGVLLVFGYGTYRIVRRMIEIGREFVMNHAAHLTATLERNTGALESLERAVTRCPCAGDGEENDLPPRP